MYTAHQTVERLVGEPLRWDEMTCPEIAALRDGGGRTVLLSIGATEQHGPHLLVNVDSVPATAFCAYASAKTGVPVLPTISIGCSLGHTDRWPGTLSHYPETVTLMVRETAEFLIRTGFERLMIVHSHFGSTFAIRCAIDRIRFDNAGRFLVGFRDTFEATKDVWHQFTEDGEEFQANRAETALMLFLDPAAVRLSRIEDDPDRTAGKVFTHVVLQTSTNGVTGKPSLATAEDGRKLFLQIGEALAAVARAATTERPPIERRAKGLSPSSFSTPKDLFVVAPIFLSVFPHRLPRSREILRSTSG